MTRAAGAGYFTGRNITELAADLRSGAITAAELAERALESIDPGLNAFVVVDEVGAREAARQADAELAGGADRGPLHGVPVAVKDIIDVAELPVGMGSAHFAGHVAESDAAIVRRLRDAGAVIIGKTTTHEFAYGASGDISVNGPARNPHDRERITGGSSAGSAAAVASGAVPLALGTDTGGSVRIPAALCGIAGFKPAYGALPLDGIFPLASSLDHPGPLAATAEDCALAYRALGGPWPAEAPGAEALTAEAPGAAPRVARLAIDLVDPEVAAVTGRHFADAPEVPLDLARFNDTFMPIQMYEVANVHRERLARAPELYHPEVRGRIEQTMAVTRDDYDAALRERDKLNAEIAALFEQYDVLVMPTVPVPAPRIGERDLPLGPALLVLRYLTSPWNLLGLPTLSIPAGKVNGLPVALQLTTRPNSDPHLFTTAAQLSLKER